MRQAIPRFSVGVGLVLAMAACTPVQLRMPEGFAASAAAWPVTGHSPRRSGEPLRFGPYSTTGVDEGATFSWRLPSDRLDIGGSGRPYAFAMHATGEASVEVQCRVSTLALGHDSENGRVESRTELDLTPLRGPALGCGLHSDDTAEAMALELARDGTRLHGQLETPWGVHDVRSLHGYEGLSATAYGVNGFEVLDNGRVVMVVDMLNAGRVHVDDSVPPDQRSFLAAAAAALLLLGADADA